MKLTKLQFITAILILTAGIMTANAAPPANNNLANAVVLGDDHGAIIGTVVDATREVPESHHTLSADETVYRTVWYQWTATDTAPVAFWIYSASEGLDTALAVYTGANYPLTPVGVNNDAYDNRPYIEFTAQQGTTYKIMVGVFNDPATTGTFNLQWEIFDRPTNDDFVHAKAIQNRAGSVVYTVGKATAEPGESLFGSGRSVWFNYTNTTPNDYSVTFSTLKSFDVAIDSTLSVLTGDALASLAPVVRNDNMPTTSRSRVTFLAKAGVTYRISVDFNAGAPDGNFILDWSVTKPNYYTDFGTRTGAPAEIYYDQAADLTVFRPSDGTWYSLDSTTGAFSAVQFGLSGDTPVEADYDGDGLTDYAVARNENGSKIWYFRDSFDGRFRAAQFGLAEDKPVPADFDADGRADIAVFRPSTNVWYVWRSSDDQYTIKQFGVAGDVPVIGDFAGTPAGADIAVFRPSNGFWYIFDGENTIFAQWGTAGDKPVPADYDADGKTDLAVFRPSDGTWYCWKSRTNAQQFVRWGLAGDIPMTGDYDNNSNDPDDFVVFRPANSTWYIFKREGMDTVYAKFGLPGDIPVSSPANLMQ